jgi:hypothetical protein
MQPHFREKWFTEHAKVFWALFGQTSFFFLAGVACNNTILIFYRTGPKEKYQKVQKAKDEGRKPKLGKEKRVEFP